MPCRVLRNEIFTTNHIRKVKKQMSLMQSYEVKLLRMPTKGDVEPPGARCPGLPTDTVEQDSGAADVGPRRSLRLRKKANQVKDT